LIQPIYLMALVTSTVVVRTAGVEPAQPCGRGILSPLRLPVSPRPHDARFFHILRRK
jgi:hypothetical protein